MAFSFIVLSTEHWNSRRQARKELLYRALLQTGHVDYLAYIEPMCPWWQGDWSAKVTREGAAYVYRWICPFPGERCYPVLSINRCILASKVARIVPEHHRSSITGILYHPYNWLTAQHVRWVRHWLFDWTEDWGMYHRSSSVAALQDKAIQQCDGVIAVSEALYKRARSLRRDDRVLFLPNATALQPSDRLGEPEELVDIRHPRIGFMGHVGPWMDWDLVRRVAERIPEYQWCIVGYASSSIRKQVHSLRNIHFLGLQSYHALSTWMACMDVLVAPYTTSAQANCNSSKLYDYLFSGKPIVSSPISPAHRFPGLIEVVPQDPEAWEMALTRSLQENDPDRVRRRKKVAAENTWVRRAYAFLDWLRERSSSRDGAVV